MGSNNTNLPLILLRALLAKGWDPKARYWPKVGGNTANTGFLEYSGGRCFVKMHSNAALLSAEDAGLVALEPWLKVPRILGRFSDETGGVLFLDALALEPLGLAGWRAAGVALAQLHSQAVHTVYGGVTDNFIGGTPQYNKNDTDWCRFFARQRLLPQLDWAQHKGLSKATCLQVHRVVKYLPRWLPRAPASGLLHGDLWVGNLGQIDGSEPVFFDPACYYGDPQVDLAMLNLFGQPPEAFYQGYQGRLPDNHQRGRWPVYDLYHWLNHFNLFGQQ